MPRRSRYLDELTRSRAPSEYIRPPAGAPLEGYGKATRTLAKVMEYRAVAEALAVLPEGTTAVVFSDNQPMVESLAKSLNAWRSSGFANVDARSGSRGGTTDRSRRL